MKKYLILLFLITACTPEKPSVMIEENNIELVTLDRSRMEKLIEYMPIILRYSEQFQEIINPKGISDQEYNKKLYEYLFQNEEVAKELRNAGFDNAEIYQKFYDTLIEMYLLLQEQPDLVDMAVISIPNHQKEVDSLLLKQAKEPNNKKLVQTLDRLQYELIVYRNLVIVNAFLGQLNALNNVNE